METSTLVIKKFYIRIPRERAFGGPWAWWALPWLFALATKLIEHQLLQLLLLLVLVLLGF